MREGERKRTWFTSTFCSASLDISKNSEAEGHTQIQYLQDIVSRGGSKTSEKKKKRKTRQKANKWSLLSHRRETPWQKGPKKKRKSDGKQTLIWEKQAFKWKKWNKRRENANDKKKVYRRTKAEKCGKEHDHLNRSKREGRKRFFFFACAWMERCKWKTTLVFILAECHPSPLYTTPNSHHTPTVKPSSHTKYEAQPQRRRCSQYSVSSLLFTIVSKWWSDSRDRLLPNLKDGGGSNESLFRRKQTNKKYTLLCIYTYSEMDIAYRSIHTHVEIDARPHSWVTQYIVMRVEWKVQDHGNREEKAKSTRPRSP